MTGPRRVHTVVGVVLTILCLILIAVIVMAIATPLANGHHTLPVQKVSTIKRVYPDLYARELRRDHPSWNHLRRMASSRYDRTHKWARYAAHPTPAGNRALARREFGASYECAAAIIGPETGWTWRHDIAYGFRYGEHLIFSGLAYGLPQAKPGTKMLKAGQDAAGNPATQLRWMHNYVAVRYGGACGALSFRRANGWY